MPHLINWANFYREICSRWLLDNPIRFIRYPRQLLVLNFRLGGVDRIVQIDESLVSKRKYHRGRLVREIWVFALYDVHSGIGVLRVVPNRNRATLLPIIEEFVMPGSTIHSDQWGAYMGGAIDALPVIPPYVHHSVNHTNHFVDPINHADTNSVECFWKNLKMKFKAMSGTSRELLPGYLDEFCWRQRNGKKTLVAYDNILSQISQYFLVNT